MDIFSVLALIGGLAMFLYGMNVLSSSLEKTAGGRLERILYKITDTPIKAVLAGMGVTATIQSSSATTVMVVGFVNSGMMKLRQAIGVIMGANIGTTITAWILSLAGIESSNIFISLLKPINFCPILAIIGVSLIMFSKRGQRRDIGGMLVGFAVLMFGMDMMSESLSGLSESPEFASILIAFSNPLWGILAGALITAIIQSSSASIGILQALSVTGTMPYSIAIPIIMGQNIGTCITALLSCIGANKNAKRAAVAHLLFNIIGTVLFLTLFYVLNAVIGFAFVDNMADPAGIAIIHTVFNVFSTLVLLPFTNMLAKLSTLIIRDGKETKAVQNELPMLDERFLSSTALATEQSVRAASRMAELAQQNIERAMSLLNKYDKSEVELLATNEDLIDTYEDKLGTYLVKLSAEELSESDSNTVSMLLHVIGDFERIGDHAINIGKSADEIVNDAKAFSSEAVLELKLLQDAVKEILDLAIRSFNTRDSELATHVEPLEQVIDIMREKIKLNHILRVRKGVCTIEKGFVFSDIINDLERVSDHCSNIAAAVIEITHSSFAIHDYLHGIKDGNTPEFIKVFNMYENKYRIE